VTIEGSAGARNRCTREQRGKGSDRSLGPPGYISAIASVTQEHARDFASIGWLIVETALLVAIGQLVFRHSASKA